MGLGEAAKAMIFVKADTSDAKAKLRDLRGEEAKRHRALIDEMSAQNKKIDDQIAFWGKMAIGIGAAVGAVKLAHSAMGAYLEDVRLESAAAGANLDGLQKATRGLIEADNLLAFAGKAMNGVWKLNQGEMEAVLRGATALRKTMGVELRPTVDALTEAVARGNTRALKEFGIEAKDKAGLIKELTGLYDGLGGKVGLAGDSITKAGVDIHNSFDDLQGKLGEMVVAMMPAIDSLTTFVNLLTNGISNLQTFADTLAGAGSIWGDGQPKWMQLQAQQAGLRADAGRIRAGDMGSEADRAARAAGVPNYSGMTNLFEGDAMAGVREAMAADLERQADQLQAQIDAAYKKTAAKVFEESAKKPPRAPTASGRRSDPLEVSLGLGAEWQAGQLGLGERGMAGLGSSGVISDQEYAAAAASVGELQAAFAAMQADFARRDEDTILTQIFGTPAEIDAQVEAIRLASDMFGTFTGAAAEAYDVLISGSGNAMAAFQRAIAGGIAAMGKEMLVKGLSESAWAIADLARGNFAGAAGHGQAAAGFFAGATVAGVVANSLGYGSAAPSSGGGAGGAPSVIGSGRGRSADSEPATINVYVGAEWGSLSSMDQANAINRAVRLGRRGSSQIRRH